MTSLSAPMKFRQCVALHWSRWIALLGEYRYSSSLALQIFKRYFHYLLWILKGKFHAQSTRCVGVCEVLVRECAQNVFFFFTTVIILVTCWHSPKEDTSFRVVDVYAKCLGQSVFPFLWSWMSQNQKRHTITNLRKLHAFLDWASQRLVSSDQTPFVAILNIVAILSIKENGQIKFTVVVKQTEKVVWFFFLGGSIFSTFINLALSVFTVKLCTAARA